MSLVITLYVREGIVMAADSRLSLNAQAQQADKRVVNLAVAQSDANYKLFLAPHSIGISTYGAADIRGVPLAGYIESFIEVELKDRPPDVHAVANGLLEHFSNHDPSPAAEFHVAGYSVRNGAHEEEVWHVAITQGQVTRLNAPGQQGASWGGEGDVLARLLQPVAQVAEKRRPQQELPLHQIPWQFFTLQDAIDFARFAIRSTADAMRFQLRPKTVGGRPCHQTERCGMDSAEGTPRQTIA